MASVNTAKKGVRNITLTFGEGQSATVFTGRLRGSVVYKGSTVEVDKIAAYGDTAYTSVPRSVKSWNEFTFTVLDQGESGDVSLENFTGKVTKVTITPSYGSGAGSDTDLNPPISVDMVITNVAAGGEITVDGESTSTITITAVPHAPVGA